MNLYEIAPTIHWLNSTEAQASAEIKTADHTFDLKIKCAKYSQDHLVGWVGKVVDKEKDHDSGRFVDLTLKSNRQSFDGVEKVFDRVGEAVSKYRKEHELKFVVLFSTTPARRETFEKLSKKIAKKLDWQVYQDRNYFLIYEPNLAIHQVD